MNNYSAESSTKDTLAFLEDIISKANSYMSIKFKEHDALFNEAKEYVKVLAADDDRLLLGIRGEVVYTWSKFEHWKNSSVWHQLWNNPPDDDTEEHRKQCEQKSLEDARETITITLDDMYDFQRFYNKTTLSPHIGYGYHTHYPIGHELCRRLLVDSLPDGMGQQCLNLTQYKNNLNKIQKMYDSLTVHEFETVTIEEGMLQTIELVKANIR